MQAKTASADKKAAAEKKALAEKKAAAEKKALAEKKAAAEKKANSLKQLDPQQKRDSRTELLTVSVSLDTGKIVGIVSVGLLASAFLVSAMVFISG